MGLEEITGQIGISGGGIMNIVWAGLLVILFVVVIGGAFWIFYTKSLWNLKVIFKLPRNDGKIINCEVGKGRYNKKQGVVYVKRKGLNSPKSAIEPFDIKKYIQGGNVLTVVQVGADDYIPVLESSYDKFEDDKTGERIALMDIKTDTTKSRAWKNTFEREAKLTYSITNLLREYLHEISLGIVIILWGIQFIIIYTKVA